MENRNILMLRHHPMNIRYSNLFYMRQTNENLDDFIVVDVTSRAVQNKKFMSEHPSFVRDLSPFCIGPVIGPDGVKAEIFEIFWQCGKVYPCHDDQGHPNDAFFSWRMEFYTKTSCTKALMRHACQSLGYTHKDCCYFVWFDQISGEYKPLSYVESRKKIYFPEYAKLVHGTESFHWLLSLLDAGKKIALVDFDSYNYNENCGMVGKYHEYLNRVKNGKDNPGLCETDFTSVNSMRKVVNCPFLPAGHGFVLKALLQGDIEIENGVVKDRAGILE